jgi:hypothetical protein
LPGSGPFRGAERAVSVGVKLGQKLLTHQAAGALLGLQLRENVCLRAGEFRLIQATVCVGIEG